MKRQRAPLLSTRQDWISAEIFTLFVATIIYTLIAWRYESGRTEGTIAVLFATMPHVSAAILPMIIAIIGIFEIIGELMIRFTSIMEKAKAEGIAEGKAEAEKARAEGKAEGKAETIAAFREYIAWEKRRDEAEANNQPFNEPPPPKPDGYPEE